RRLESELAAHIGPFAEYAVRHAATAASDIGALLAELGKHIDSDTEREQFVNRCREWLQTTAGTRVDEEAAQAAEPRAEPAVAKQQERATGSIDRPAEARSARPEEPVRPAEAAMRLPEAPSVTPGAPAELTQAVIDENVQFTVFRPRELVPNE